MNIKYLGNHAERISHLTEMREGEIYVVGRGKDAFIGFVMPSQSVARLSEEDLYLQNILVYEARLRNCGTEIEEERVVKEKLLHITDFIDVQHMGVFRPTQVSKLRKTIAEKLEAQKTETDSQ